MKEIIKITIEKIEKEAHLYIKSIGCGLIIALNLIISGIVYLYFVDIIYCYKFLYHNNKLLSLVLKLLGFWITFNTLFNYWMAILVNPGYASKVIELKLSNEEILNIKE